MSDLVLVFKQVAAWIGQFLNVCHDHWIMQIALFLIVLDLIVSVILVARGGHD